MQVITVPVADRPECENTLETAFEIAKWLSADVVGCHVRPHKKETSHAEFKLPFKLREYRDVDKTPSKKQIEMNSTSARRLFHKLAEKHDYKVVRHPRLKRDSGDAMWRELLGSVGHVMSIIGPMSDMVVVSRPQSKASVRSRAFMLGALMHSARPVLILPQRRARTIGKRVLIAWNQSPEAATTVSSALPILKGAEEVVVLSCGSDSRIGPKVKHVQEYLRHWGIRSKRLVTPGRDVEDEIMEVYGEMSADMLVAGAYSRGRLRETVFGGVTQHILERTRIPALMVHHG